MVTVLVGLFGWHSHILCGVLLCKFCILTHQQSMVLPINEDDSETFLERLVYQDLSSLKVNQGSECGGHLISCFAMPLNLSFFLKTSCVLQPNNPRFNATHPSIPFHILEILCCRIFCVPPCALLVLAEFGIVQCYDSQGVLLLNIWFSFLVKVFPFLRFCCIAIQLTVSFVWIETKCFNFC